MSPSPPQDPTPQALPGGRRLARHAGLVSTATLLSRILGLVRDQLFALLFGATNVADAYVIAFRIPNLLRDLFAEGALSAAFIPTFTHALHHRSREEAFRLANRLMTTLAVLLVVLVLAGEVFAPQLVALIAPGFDAIPGKSELTVSLTRVMLWFLPLVSFAAVMMGMLNALDRFFIPAFAPACFNLVAIVVGIGLWFAGFSPVTAAYGWAIGTLLGGAAQAVVQLPPLRRESWRFAPELDAGFRDPAMRRIATLMGPATAGLAATQVNIFVNSIFASQQAGAASWLQYAFRLMQLPLGLFGVAVGTIATAALARRAAANDHAGMRETTRQSLRLVAFLTIPASFGLAVLAQPIIRLIYERGEFGATDTVATAAALLFYVIGLFAYSSVKVLAPAFYSLGRATVPLLASVSAVLANLVLNVALYPVLGYRGLALGTAVAATVNFLVLAGAFQRGVGGLGERGLWVAVAKVTAASAGMALAAWGAWRLLEAWIGTGGLLRNGLDALLPVGVGILAYAALCRLLRVSELDDMLAFLRRRRGA